MSMFRPFGGNSKVTFATTADLTQEKPLKVVNPPEDSVSCLRFSPISETTGNKTFLVAGSWDNSMRCWEINHDGRNEPKAQQSMAGPILDCCWHDDGTKVFMSSCDNQAKCWDLATNQAIQVAEHARPIKSIRWIKAPNYSALMTGSWDKLLKFWDLRSPHPIMTFDLGERCFCADADYPWAVVGTAAKGVCIYDLEGQPKEFKKVEPPLKCKYRCVSLFRDKQSKPVGFAIGSEEGRVAIHYMKGNAKDNFTFKCHRSNINPGECQDVYAVHDISFHPIHGTLATVGSDGKFYYWDKDARTKLKTSEVMDYPITCCSFSSNGQIFAYAVCYDWSKGHEYATGQMKPQILLSDCFVDLKPRPRNLSEAAALKTGPSSEDLKRMSSQAPTAPTFFNASGIGCRKCGRSFSIPGSSTVSFAHLPKQWASTVSATSPGEKHCNKCPQSLLHHRQSSKSSSLMTNPRRDLTHSQTKGAHSHSLLKHRKSLTDVRKMSSGTDSGGSDSSSSSSSQITLKVSSSEQEINNPSNSQEASVPKASSPKGVLKPLKSSMNKSEHVDASSPDSTELPRLKKPKNSGRRVRLVESRICREWTWMERCEEYTLLLAMYTVFACVMLSL